MSSAFFGRSIAVPAFYRRIYRLERRTARNAARMIKPYVKQGTVSVRSKKLYALVCGSGNKAYIKRNQHIPKTAFAVCLKIGTAQYAEQHIFGKMCRLPHKMLGDKAAARQAAQKLKYKIALK